MATTAVSERPSTRAVAKYIGRSPYKVRHVVNLIRGLDAEAAQNELLLCERGAAEEVSKLLNSAIANAEHNNHIPAEELRVSQAFVDEGPTMKRFRARARGRGSRIFKRTSHITIVVERMSDEDIAAKSQRESNTGAANAREQRRRRAEASKAAAAAKAAEAEESSQANADAEASDPVASVDNSSPSSTTDSPKVKEASSDKDAEKKPAKKVAKKTTAKKADADEKPVKKAAKKTTAKKTEEKEGDA